ncbi:MAG: hypothetical protein H7A32_02020 [Deltaproteobacteria bacterium]|nr:hypothetical protein [Deltaproteobacteria bacterium]
MKNKNKIPILFLFFFAEMYFFSVNLVYSETVQLEGEIMPMAMLEIDLPNARLSSEGQTTGTIDFGQVNAMGLAVNPLGRLVVSSEYGEAYYQADVTLRAMASGFTDPISLVVSQTDQGPLSGLIYESDQSFDISQTRSLNAIPNSPTKRVVIASVNTGITEYYRQIILRVPRDLSSGLKTATLEYHLEVCQ